MNKYYLIITLFYLLTSCNGKFDFPENEESYPLIEVNLSSFKSYNNLYINFNEQIEEWIKDSLCVSESLVDHNWRLDSLFSFNTDSNYCVGFIAKQSLHELAVFDYLMEVNGFRVDNQWRFFKMGNNLVIPREGYGNDKQEAKGLPRKSLSELSQIGRRDIIKTLNREKFEDRLAKWSSYGKCNLDSTECMKTFFDSLYVEMHECKIDFPELKRQTKHWEKYMLKNRKK